VEANMSEIVKTMLQGINVQDTTYTPAGDMFEIGAKVQVLKRGVFFPARANKLYMLYNHYDSLDEIPTKIRHQLENNYFHRSFEDIWEVTKKYFYQKGDHKNIEHAEKTPKHKMALVFRWYFSYSSKLAASGDENDVVNFQVHTGPALGAFNQWVKGTQLESWKNRHVAAIAEKIMQGTAALIEQRMAPFFAKIPKRTE
jgi:trans-AT polyketide synthase/acyltransferase/oxidoreductase domain-containing protein